MTAVATLASAVGASAWMAQRERDACARGGEAIDQLWNDEQRARLRGAIVDRGPSFGADTWTRIEPRLDGYAARWAELL